MFSWRGKTLEPTSPDLQLTLQRCYLLSVSLFHFTYILDGKGGDDDEAIGSLSECH